MTFVVGIHLGDAVGVLGDTRVTVCGGPRVEYFDNALKVYQRPPLLIGLAGDAIASDLVVTKFQLDHLVPLGTAEAYARAVDADWVTSRIGETYDAALRQGLVDQDTQFSLIIAAEDSVGLGVRPSERRDSVGILSDATVASSASVVSVDEGEAGKRLVLAMDLPSRRLDLAHPGTVVMRGSGTISEAFLRTKTTALCAWGLSFGDRLASIAREMLRAAEHIDDPSFNAVVLGWARSHGYAESVLQDLASWPGYSAPPESYAWDPFDEGDRIPECSPYAVGSDLDDFELGWIYDVGRRRKLRIEPIMKGVGRSGGRMLATERYIV